MSLILTPPPGLESEEAMSQRITIDPVTRIEGHAKITLQLDDAGQVEDAHFHVTQVRGFEKFCEGRPFAQDAFPDGTHLWHLSREPPDCIEQSM